MASIGTIVLSQEVPPSVINPNNTANAFMVGLADWGPVGASGVNTSVSSLGAAAAVIGPPNGGLIQNSRTTTDATLYDSADVFFREGGANLYISRVLGPNPTKGLLALQDSTGGNAATLTATYLGPGSSAINVVVANAGASYTITLQDGSANVLATSPSLSNTSPKTDLINWAATTNLVVATTGNTKLPATLVATPLSTGIDDHANATITNWQNALAGFGFSLGPGQVMAPNQNNTSLAGIWSALGNHALNNNRIALLDGTDGNTATAAVAEVTTAALPTSIQGYCGIWAGNLIMPGITAGTTRTVAPSPVVAALCARADNMGNPNIAAAGTQFPLQYVSGINTVYTGPISGDISTLNNSGINVFSNQLNILQNFGFVSAYGTPANDAIYWQLDHGRLRMAIIYQAAIASQPFQFSQLDGQGQTTAAFGGALQGMLLNFFNVGALFGTNATDAFTVNVGSTVNTPASLQAGNLVGILAVRMSPFAQLVTITINAVPITQTLVQTAAPSAVLPTG
jgi:hypothetical protein